jgi:hypothetical protein
MSIDNLTDLANLRPTDSDFFKLPSKDIRSALLHAVPNGVYPSSDLFHYYSFKNTRLRFPSDQVGELFFKYVRTLEAKMHQQAAASELLAALPTAWFAFETFMHFFLKSNPTISPTSLDPYGLYTLRDLKINISNIFYFDKTELPPLLVNSYYIPRESNCAAIDSFYICSDYTVIAFQSTIAKSHLISLVGLSFLLQWFFCSSPSKSSSLSSSSSSSSSPSSSPFSPLPSSSASALQSSAFDPSQLKALHLCFCAPHLELKSPQSDKHNKPIKTLDPNTLNINSQIQFSIPLFQYHLCLAVAPGYKV